MRALCTLPHIPLLRDNQALLAVKAAIAKPKTSDFRLIECEFPPLKELNKLGDGSMKSANEVEQANLNFGIKLIKDIAPIPFLGPKMWLLTSSTSTNAFVSKAEAAAMGSGATIDTLRNGIPDGLTKSDICVVLAPTGDSDYRMVEFLAESNRVKAVVIINCLAKNRESVSGRATMAYFLKPLTYNSMVSGFLLRNYPMPWTVFDAMTEKSLATFTDTDILFGDSNTPDLRKSGRLVQKATDDRAIASRDR